MPQNFLSTRIIAASVNAYSLGYVRLNTMRWVSCWLLLTEHKFQTCLTKNISPKKQCARDRRRSLSRTILSEGHYAPGGRRRAPRKGLRSVPLSSIDILVKRFIK